jgi:uncharacterized protein DUF6983
VPLEIDIPLSEGAPLPFFDMQTSLESVTYTLQFKWNVRAASWYLDVLDEAGVTYLTAGLKLVADWPLGAYRANRQPPGAFAIVDSGGEDADPDDLSLGVRHKLVYFTSAELGL